MTQRRREKQSTTTGTTTGAITLAGSTKLVTEFFNYSINSILYQRAIYPPEDFKMVKKYGLTLLTTADEVLEDYIAKIMLQVQTWILAGNVSRLVMAIVSKETRETLERWQFDLNLDSEGTTTTGKENGFNAQVENTPKPPKQEKSSAQIQKDIQDIIRQITSSVTFLPSMEEKCSFTILVYTDKDATVPKEWLDSDPHMIAGNAEQVKLRSFSTNIHKVEALVAYRLGPDVL